MHKSTGFIEIIISAGKREREPFLMCTSRLTVADKLADGDVTRGENDVTVLLAVVTEHSTAGTELGKPETVTS